MTARKRVHYDPYHDLYVVIGVSPFAPPDQIQRAYRARAKQVHPDVNPANPEAVARFQALNEAYDLLSDPNLRLEYDRQRREALGFDFVGAAYSDPARTSKPFTVDRDTFGVGYGGQRTYWGAILRGLLRGYSYRMVLVILGAVLVVNGIFIVMLPQINAFMEPIRNRSAAATLTALPTLTPTITITPTATRSP